MGVGVREIMRLLFKLFFILILANIILQGCTTCNEVKLSTSRQGIYTAEVRHRVCGTYSGYAVAVYRTNEGPPGYGEGYKEPFQAIYKTELYKERPLPVTIKWKTDGHLVVHHTTRSSLDDNKSNPMITKADASCEDVFIEYDPKPVIWDK
jgi:hypothetical protein